MLANITWYLYLGMAISCALAAYQDFRSQEVSDLVWVPAIVGITTFMVLVGSFQVFAVEFVWVAIMAGIGVTLFHIKKFASGDVLALTLIAFAPVASVISLFAGLVFSMTRFRNKLTGKIPFVGYFSLAFLVFLAATLALPNGPNFVF